jgi:hypothetical protein
MALRAGDWVEVRSKEEILGTLDKDGRLEQLPFMPEMFQSCGKRFRVFKRAHKTCDTVNQTAGRWIPNGIHLDTRCDGKAHGNCQAACLIFWKEAWLKPVDESGQPKDAPSPAAIKATDHTISDTTCSEADVWRATRAESLHAGEETRYVCQATELPSFSTRARWWDARQYVEDCTSGNVTLARMFRGLVYAAYSRHCRPHRTIIGPPLRWLYDWFQALRGGIPFPHRVGTLAPGQAAPIAALNLQPGEFVRVKSYEEILATLDASNKNRGLHFDAEMVPYCGGIYRVRTRVNNFLNEKTGRMMALKTPAVILENVWCGSRYASCRMFCPRSIYCWWREVWLERVTEGDRDLSSSCEANARDIVPA